MTLSLLYPLLTGIEHILDTFDDGQQLHFGVQPFLNQSIQEQQGMVLYYLPSVSDNGETKETMKMKNKNFKNVRLNDQGFFVPVTFCVLFVVMPKYCHYNL